MLIAGNNFCDLTIYFLYLRGSLINFLQEKQLITIAWNNFSEFSSIMIIKCKEEHKLIDFKFSKCSNI